MPGMVIGLKFDDGPDDILWCCAEQPPCRVQNFLDGLRIWWNVLGPKAAHVWDECGEMSNEEYMRRARGARGVERGLAPVYQEDLRRLHPFVGRCVS